MFDEVIVQNEPAWPLYCEHSFVTWRAPPRGELPALLATASAETAVMPAASMKTAISPAKRLRISCLRISPAPFLSLLSSSDSIEEFRCLLELPVRLREVPVDGSYVESDNRCDLRRGRDVHGVLPSVTF